MPRLSNYFDILITNAGGIIDLSIDEPYAYYVADTSTITLASSLIITSSVGSKQGITFEIRYNGIGLVLAPGSTVTIFGVLLTSTQATKKGIFTSIYDGTGWVTTYSLSAEQTDTVNTDNIVALAVTTAKINDLAVTAAKIDNLAVTAAKIVANTITRSQILPGTLTDAEIGAGAISSVSLAGNLLLRTIVLPVSFETDEVGDFKIMMSEAGTLDTIYAYAYKVIAATDNATIVPKNNAGTTMATGTVTFTASDARGTAYTTNPSTNNTFIAGDILTFTCAKDTVGGRAMLSLNYTIA